MYYEIDYLLNYDDEILDQSCYYENSYIHSMYIVEMNATKMYINWFKQLPGILFYQ